MDALTVFVTKRRQPISGNAPPLAFGSMPNDGGNLLLSAAEKDALLEAYPSARPWLRRLVGSEEFINGTERWCLWLVNAEPKAVRQIPIIVERIEHVKAHRAASSRETTRELAKTPMLFGEIRQPKQRYVAIPEVSSETRRFIPIDFQDATVIATNKLYTIDGGSLFHLGVLCSTMHMAWVRTVCGRLKSDYQYSAGIVYNNFPWPVPTDAKLAAVESAAQGVLDARAAHPA